MHTKDKLAAALRAIGLNEMADKAATGYYHDFLSPIELPEIQLINDLGIAGTPEAMALRLRVINGDFDASKEESDEWAASEDGQIAFNKLIKLQPSKHIGRLALRHEGDFWNAYYAMPNTMKGAILLGSIAMRFVIQNKDRKRAFWFMMRDAVSDIIEEQTGTRPTWPDEPIPAPESERSGHE